MLYQEDTYYYLQQSVSLICFKVVDEYYACLSKFRKRKKNQNIKNIKKQEKTENKNTRKKKLRDTAIVACVCFNVSALRKKLEGGIDNKLKERRS